MNFSTPAFRRAIGEEVPRARSSYPAFTNGGEYGIQNLSGLHFGHRAFAGSLGSLFPLNTHPQSCFTVGLLGRWNARLLFGRLNTQNQ